LENDSLTLKGVPVPTCFRYQKQQNPTTFKSHFVQGMAVLYNKAAKPKPVTVPNLQMPLIEAMRDYLADRGSQLRVAFTYEAGLRPFEDEFLQARNIPFLHLPQGHQFEEYGQHWTPEGHRRVTGKILESFYKDSVVLDWEFDRDYQME
jgi:hypothetical protein